MDDEMLAAGWTISVQLLAIYLCQRIFSPVHFAISSVLSLAFIPEGIFFFFFFFFVFWQCQGRKMKIIWITLSYIPSTVFKNTKSIKCYKILQMSCVWLLLSSDVYIAKTKFAEGKLNIYVLSFYRCMNHCDKFLKVAKYKLDIIMNYFCVPLLQLFSPL